MVPPGLAFVYMSERAWAANADAKMPRFYFDACLLYTSDAADDLLCVDLGGRRIIKKKKTKYCNDHPRKTN